MENTVKWTFEVSSPVWSDETPPKFVTFYVNMRNGETLRPAFGITLAVRNHPTGGAIPFLRDQVTDEVRRVWAPRYGISDYQIKWDCFEV